MGEPERRLRAIQTAVGLIAASLLALNLAAFGWGWQLVAGAPRESGYLLGQMLRATVRDLSRPDDIQASLQYWVAHNPDALAALVVDDQGWVVAAVPIIFRGEHLSPDAGAAAWVSRRLGTPAAGYMAQERPLGAPDRAFGRAIAVVPDVAPTLISTLFIQLIRLNPLWLILYWALLPTWVYLDALRHARPRIARRWALLCLALNLPGLGLYLAAGWWRGRALFVPAANVSDRTA